MKLRLELITWRDHWSQTDSDWLALDDQAPAEPLHCQSVGWVIAENARMVSLVHNLDGGPDEAEHGSGTIHILKSAIVSRKRLG